MKPPAATQHATAFKPRDLIAVAVPRAHHPYPAPGRGCGGVPAGGLPAEANGD
jgi:hypothetical protein